MRGTGFRGAACVEFAFISVALVPLLLGTGATGINMILTLQTIQLARDAGHMYARGLDFSQPGNQTILTNLGSTLGLSTTASSSNAVVILTALTYVDNAACVAGGAATGGTANSNCKNLNHWVFAQRLVIGKSSIHTSQVGTPTGVTIASNGKILVTDYVTNTGAQATFSSINPYADVNGTVSGLPSGQMLYVAEAAATAFSMPPFIGPSATYSYGLF
jgi:Flp pilus assembly protein TadG